MGRKERVELSGLSAGEVARRIKGKSVSYALHMAGIFPDGVVGMVAGIPKNGKINRCSSCRTAITPANVRGVPKVVDTVQHTRLNVVVVVCSERCAKRLADV